MSNETKRDVYEEIVNEYGFPSDEGYKQLMDWYDAALPDDLPVIPKEVSDRLKQAKTDRSSLRYMFAASSIDMLSGWWMAQNPENEDTFARAWLLESWIVEETGEIVKLEAEK